MQISIVVFWFVKPCGLVSGLRFGGTYYLHLQGFSKISTVGVGGSVTEGPLTVR
jgi:hypothetical protein